MRTGGGLAELRLLRFNLMLRLRRGLAFRLDRLRPRGIIFRPNEDEERFRCTIFRARRCASTDPDISGPCSTETMILFPKVSDPGGIVLQNWRDHSHCPVRRAGRGFSRQRADPLTARFDRLRSVLDAVGVCRFST